MIRIFWFGNALLFLLLVLSVVLTFSKSEATPVKLSEIPNAPQSTQETKQPLEYYSDIWNVTLNTNPPAAPPTKPTVPSDWHKQLLEKNVKIKQVLSNGYALIMFSNQEKLLEARTEVNKNDASKPWELTISGNKVIVLSIVPGKGICFQFPDKKEVWLSHKDPTNSQVTPSTNPSSINEPTDTSAPSLPPAESLAETGQWEITSEEGTELLKGSDTEIEAMAPQVELDQNGNPIGIKLRRVGESSKAFRYGLRENDIIKSINGSPTNALSPEAIRRLIDSHKKDKHIVVNIMRNNAPTTIRFNVRK